jgi:transcriptional regulator with PAS, ATPase and Fis domain
VADLTDDARLRGRVDEAVPSMVGRGPAMLAVREAIGRAARAPFAVLIEGESGAGKELVARAIHGLSARGAGAFCDVNCAALPDELLESELFGHAKGAFTGAVADRPGLFEHATGGTVFLDEVADLSPRAQAKLLRVLQQQEVRRVGEATSRRIDVRVISAANRDMRDAAGTGRFRDDLLYRLDVIRIRVPPLRERPEDVPALCAHIWASAAESVGTCARLSPMAIDALTRYAWPGNVRELQNVLAALAAAAPARGLVPLRLLPDRVASAAADALPMQRLDEARDAFERRFIEAALSRAGGGRTRAAEALGLSRQGLAKVMLRLGLPATPASSVESRRCSASSPDASC